MNLTLRKAARVRSQIELQLREIKSKLMETSMPVNVFDRAILDNIKAKRDDYRRIYAQYEALTSALYELRILIGSANETAGVSAKLAHIALMTEQMNQIRYMTVGKRDFLSDANIIARINGHLETVKNATTSAISSQTLVFDIVEKDFVEQLEAAALQLKKNISDTTDDIEAINVRTTITLSDTVVTLLTANNLL